MHFNAHIYETQQAAAAAVALINKGEGIPVYDNAATQTYTQEQLHSSGCWYIKADDITIKYLGEPQELEEVLPQGLANAFNV